MPSRRPAPSRADRCALADERGLRGEYKLEADAEGQLIRMAGGRIAEVRGHYSDQYAFDVFWQPR